MKRLSTGKVIWTATEEKYDLSTASGEAFVNMKLTMAQFEADQASERIRMVNEYKVKSGQPLYGSQCLPFCYQVEQPAEGERHKYITKRDDDIMQDLIEHFCKNHSVRAAMHYVNQKHNRTFSYAMVMGALTNEMICGSYKGNPNYCEGYVTREEFETMQKHIKRNPRTSPNEHVYIFTGLLRCPGCGNRLVGAHTTSTRNGKNGKKLVYRYHGYRCNKGHVEKTCTFKTIAFERSIETAMLAAIEDIVKNKRLNVISIQSETQRIGKYDLTALQEELNRLNYSWQKGRIKKVEDYDKQYDELMAKIDAAHEEHSELSSEPDYEKVQLILTSGWKSIYAELDAEHKRAFWRSFVDEIQLEWTKDVKRIADVNFFV
jgi:hypothetical protein